MPSLPAPPPPRRRVLSWWQRLTGAKPQPIQRGTVAPPVDVGQVYASPVVPPLPTPPPPTTPRLDAPPTAASTPAPGEAAAGEFVDTAQLRIDGPTPPVELARRSVVAELQIRNVGAYSAWLGPVNVTAATGRELRPHDPPLTIRLKGVLYATVRSAEQRTTLEVVVL